MEIDELAKVLSMKILRIQHILDVLARETGLIEHNSLGFALSKKGREYVVEKVGSDGLLTPRFVGCFGGAASGVLVLRASHAVALKPAEQVGSIRSLVRPSRGCAPCVERLKARRN